MDRIVTSVRWLLLALLGMSGFAGFGGVALGAQSPDLDPAFYESELSGLEIEIDGDDFEIYEAEVRNYGNGQGEIVEIASNTAYIQVAFFDDTDTNQETLDIYNEAFSGDVDDFEVLDEGEDGDRVFTWALATYNGVEFYYYLSVTQDVEANVDLLQRIFATDATFFDDLANAQDAISIDRDGFLEAVDVADLEDTAGAAPRQQDEPTSEPADEPTETPEESATEPPVEEPIPTIDPAGATVREMVVVDADLVATSDVEVGPGSAEAPAYEEIPMRLGDGEAILVMLMRPESPEATLDFVLSVFTPEGGELQNVGTDADRTSAWSLDLVSQEGEEHLLYVHVQSDRFERFHYTEILSAPVDAFPVALAGFQENVQIGGVPMFHEADLETLNQLLGGGGAPDTRDTQGSQQDDKRDTEGTEEGQGGNLDLESQGLVSPTEYESPQYGVAVEWDDAAWTADQEWDQTAVSDPETGVDSLILFHADGDATLIVQIVPSEGAEPGDYVQVWETDDYAAENVHEDAEVLLSDSGSRSGGVVYRTVDADGNEVILVQEAIYIDDEVAAIVTIFSTPGTIADAYADAEDTVSVDGKDAAGTFTPREIERAVEP